jgi:hypothetical protein
MNKEEAKKRLGQIAADNKTKGLIKKPSNLDGAKIVIFCLALAITALTFFIIKEGMNLRW